MDFENILNEAYKAASAGVQEEASRRPEDPMAFDCGFAWVTIEGTSPLARHCAKETKLRGESLKYGSKGYPKGWQFWCPGRGSHQSVRLHKAGATAFQEILSKYGIKSTVGYRLD